MILKNLNYHCDPIVTLSKISLEIVLGFYGENMVNQIARQLISISILPQNRYTVSIGEVGEVAAVLIGFWRVFFSAEYTILDKLFESCPFMQTVMPHENHAR